MYIIVPEATPSSSSGFKEANKGTVPPPVPPRTNHSHHVTTTYITQDEVTVSTGTSTTLGGANSTGSSHETSAGVQIAVNSDPKKKNEILKLREMLLSDNSVESS